MSSRIVGRRLVVDGGPLGGAAAVRELTSPASDPLILSTEEKIEIRERWRARKSSGREDCNAKHTQKDGYWQVMCTCSREPGHAADYHEDASVPVRWPVESVSPASIGREPIAAAMTDTPPSIREPADADDRGPVRTWGTWQAPPRRRRNITSTARLPGAGKVHLTIDLDDAGKPCAIWAEVHKEGSIVRGMLDCVAALASQALQHGASIHEVAERMIGVRFEPDGAVEGHATVRECLSIVDLLGRMIEAEFPRAPREERRCKVVERDPRIDPRPGDILSNGRCMVEVLEIDERGMIFCERYEPYLTRGDRVYRFQIALCYFRKGAAPSSVVVLAMAVPR